MSGGDQVSRCVCGVCCSYTSSKTVTTESLPDTDEIIEWVSFDKDR